MSDKLLDLLGRAVAAGIVARSGGGWLHFGETKLGQGAEKAGAFLADNTAIVAAIEAALAPNESSKDAPRAEAQDAEAAKSIVAASGTAPGVAASPPQSGGFVELFFPLPPDLPEEALKAVSIVVKARPMQGRWRIGRKFTREETVIPYPGLSAEQIAALTGDPEIAVSLRMPKPG